MPPRRGRGSGHRVVSILIVVAAVAMGMGTTHATQHNQFGCCWRCLPAALAIVSSLVSLPIATTAAKGRGRNDGGGMRFIHVSPRPAAAVAVVLYVNMIEGV